MQDTPYVPLQYPNIFGTDVSGTVVALGTDVTRFNIGQRVIAHCDSLMTHQPSRAGFQSYTTCREILVAAIPDSLPLAAGAVLPLSISTAAAGLFNNLALPFPALDPVPSGKTVLIWGGSSSCGSSSIQLAVAAGYKVAATAGKANQEYVNHPSNYSRKAFAKFETY
jgi:NADPH:quinone reductase-like Zn-dependent oxidoreductase